MERVKKGEKYYVLLMDKFGILPLWHHDYRQQSDKLLFEAGNYFYTKEEAETMARKIRAVLKGADVIEMPSQDEIDSETALSYPMYMGNYEAYKEGWKRSIEWLKSKIVK